ncbi:MAG: hypothetical protein ABUL60_11800 [Myxococcales bacterium]
MKLNAVSRLVVGGVALAASLMLTRTAQANNCAIGYGYGQSLKNMSYKQAYGLFENIYQEWCPSMSSVGTYFRLTEGANAVGHMHFWADDPTVTCIAYTATWPNGVMGRGSPCVAVDPLTTSREVSFHTSIQQAKIAPTGATYRWRVSSIQIRGTVSAQVIVQQTDGTWWTFNNLTPGVWNLGSTGVGASAFFVQNQNSADGSHVTFDNTTVQTF